MLEHHFHIKVYYKDIDRMGIVYYSRYFEFFEQARTELLKSKGITVTDIEESGITLPVILAHCEYVSSAKFEDKLVIISQINELPISKLKINYFIKANGANDIIVKGYTYHAFMKKNGKPTRAPKLVLNKIKPFLNNE
jgi:acyl-CoA thioester hydrolase